MRIRATAVAAMSVLSLAGQSSPVNFDRLLKAETEPGNWLMHNHTYNGWRYSLLDQITPENVKICT
jgi:glucose dehydrogenase